MKTELLLKGLSKMISGILFMGILLFWPAGTFSYSGAYRMMAVLFIPMLMLGGYLYFRKPELLKKRLSTEEKEDDQKLVILFSLLMFVASFVLCGFDFRYKWTKVPMWLVIIGMVVFVLTYVLFAELLKENEYLSRTVEVQENQKVVDTGLYGIVRHPMYSIITFMFVSMPIIIGSFVGIIPLTALPLLLAKRIKNEEKVLEEGLEGYKEYKTRVKYRMVPYIW